MSQVQYEHIDIRITTHQFNQKWAQNSFPPALILIIMPELGLHNMNKIITRQHHTKVIITPST